MSVNEVMQPTSVRLPAWMRRQLRIKAATNDQTMTAEILARLRKSLMEDEEATGVASPNSAPAAVNAPEQNHSEASSHAAD